MLLTALVQYSRGTLILNLPRDRYDLALKLDSIGITKKFWDKLRIADDEDNEFSVKLFGENDIGKHLSLIFTENDTIFDVNKTLQILENSIEEIRDDLEMNIVHDQYDMPAELIADIERMTDEVGRFTETFTFRLSATWMKMTATVSMRLTTACSSATNGISAICFKRSRI